MFSNRALRRGSLVVAFALLLIALPACGHRAGASVTVEAHVVGDYLPFRLTLVNDTNQWLLPDVYAPPYELSYARLSIPPGGVAYVEIGYLPSRITVGAVAAGGGSSTYVYPSRTLYYGIDYFSDSSGATFIYR